MPAPSRTPHRGAWMETEKTLASVAEHLTSNTEDIGHGTESVEEVSDGGRVQQSDTGGTDAGEYWAEYLPKMCAEMKADGTLYKRLSANGSRRSKQKGEQSCRESK